MGVKGFAVWLAAEYPAAFAYGDPAPPPRGADGGRGGGGSLSSPPSSFASRRSAGFSGHAGGAAAAAQRASGASASSASARPPPSFDHVYVDMAGLLHTALRQGVRDEGVGRRGGDAKAVARQKKSDGPDKGASLTPQAPASDTPPPPTGHRSLAG